MQTNTVRFCTFSKDLDNQIGVGADLTTIGGQIERLSRTSLARVSAGCVLVKTRRCPNPGRLLARRAHSREDQLLDRRRAQITPRQESVTRERGIARSSRK